MAWKLTSQLQNREEEQRKTTPRFKLTSQLQEELEKADLEPKKTLPILADTWSIDGEEVPNFFRHPIKAVKEAWTDTRKKFKAGELQMTPEEIQERMVRTGLAPSEPGETTGFGNVVQRAAQQTKMLDPKEFEEIPMPTTGNKIADIAGNLVGTAIGFATGPANVGPAGGLLKVGHIGGGPIASRVALKTAPALKKMAPAISKKVSLLPKVGSKLAPKVTGESLEKLVQIAVQDAIMGGTYGVGRGLANDEPLPEVAEEGLKEAAIWTGLGLGGRAAFAGGKALKNKLLPGRPRLDPLEALSEVNKEYARGKTISPVGERANIPLELEGGIRYKPSKPDFYAEPGGRVHVGRPRLELPSAERPLLPRPRVTPDFIVEPGGRTHVGEPKLLLPSGPYERMVNQIKPLVEKEIERVYAPGYRPSTQMTDKIIRDVAIKAGYDYDKLLAEARIKPAAQKMLKVEGRALSPEQKQLVQLDEEIKSTSEYLGGLKKEIKQTIGEARKEGDLYGYIKSRGGIKPSPSVQGEYNESIPLGLKNKDGMPLDELASELGMDSRQLLDELSYKSRIFEPESAVINNPEIQAIEGTLDTLKAERETLANIINKPRVSRLNEITAKHRQEVSGGLDEAATPALGQSVKIVGDRETIYKPIVPEAEAAIKAGQKPASGWLNSVKIRISRLISDGQIEPLLKEQPRIREHIRYTKEIPSIARMEATETLEGVLGDVGRPEMNLFTRKVVYEDWQESLLRGEKIPFNLSKEQVSKELSNVEKHMTPKLKRAYERHLEVVNALAEDLVTRGKMSRDAIRGKYFPHKVLLEYGQLLDERLGLPQKLRTPFRGYVQRRLGSSKPVATDYIETMHNLITKIKIDNGIDDAIENLAKIGEDYTKKAGVPTEVMERIRRTGVPETYKGKSYRVWQPDTGNYFYPSLTITEEAVQKALAEQLPLEVQTILGESLEQGLVVGKKKPTFVLPAEVAERLNNFRRTNIETEISKILKDYTRWWKKLAVLMPGPKHDWFNLFGDLDRFTTGLGTKELPKMLLEARKMIKTNDPLLKDFLKQGVFSSEVYMYNVGKYSSPKLRELAGPIGKAAYLNPVSLYQRWRVYREAAPRIAAHLLNYERMKAGKPLKNRFAVDVKGLLPEEAVAKIGRETMVDYNMLSKNTEHAKKFWFPFITWYTQNFKSYAHMIAKKPVYGLARVFMPMAAVTVWNNVMFPDVEKNLPDYWRENPHLITGIQNSEGGYYIVPIPFAGAIAASMVGLHTLPDTVARYMTGEMPLGEALKKQGKDIAKGPVGAAWDLLTPFIRGPLEVARNKDWRGYSIVPRELQGTPEALKIQGKHLLKSLVPPVSKGMQWVGEAERTEKGIPSTPLPLRPFGARAIDPEQLKQRQIQNLIYDYAGEEMRNKVRYDFERAYLKYRKNKTPENRAKLDQAAQRLSKEQIQNIINEIENPPTSADRLKNAAKRVPKALRPELNRELQKLQSK
ncbi:MAG: hypothetical protein CVU89_03445 [Firmicutes bacterium HGW-Firmicutes-14]|nr:MAG: hypothetical protein CVU89_03445 [Firmicutes bacterium HGW-Firmicutes-14]